MPGKEAAVRVMVLHRPVSIAAPGVCAGANAEDHASDLPPASGGDAMFTRTFAGMTAGSPPASPQSDHVIRQIDSQGNGNLAPKLSPRDP
jgi:hypothetical protein